MLSAWMIRVELNCRTPGWFQSIACWRREPPWALELGAEHFRAPEGNVFLESKSISKRLGKEVIYYQPL